MRIFTPLIAAFAFFAAAFTPAHAADISAVYFYADWCTSCKIIGPQLEKAVEEFDEAEVEIVTLDFTKMDMESVMAQAEIAAEYGVGDVVMIDKVKTGFALIVVDKEIRGKISAGMDAEMIKDAFRAALAE
jgi:thiol-disulfide isomerase/thioredoxin